MADPTYEQLTTPMDRSEVLDAQLAVLASPDFNLPTESWGAFDEPYATLAADAQILADLDVKISGVAKAGVTDDADGDVLTIHAADVFDETRELGVPTLGAVTFTETDGSPQSWAAGDLIFVSRLDDSIVFTNTAAVSLLALGTASVAIAAEEIGTRYNVQGSDLLLATPIPGVTMSAALGTGWITQSGTDDEIDERLRLRCRTKWATLATTGSYDAYVKWCLDASASVNRVRVQEDPGAIYPAAAVTVIVASSTGAVSAGVLAAVAAYVEERRPLGTLVECISVSTTAFDLKGTVKVKAAKRTAAETAINELLADWFAGTTITVNGEEIAGLQIGDRVTISQLIEIVMSVPGVTAFTPKKADGTTVYVPDTDDLILALDAVATLVRDLTYVSVT